MIRKMGLCVYKKTEDVNFFKNVTLSGCIGVGAMVGDDWMVRKNGRSYVIENATNEDIKNIELGSYVQELKRH